MDEKDDLQRRAKGDQDLARMVEILPALLYGMYNSLVERGFTPDQAMSIVRAYIHGLSGGKLA